MKKKSHLIRLMICLELRLKMKNVNLLINFLFKEKKDNLI